jgi:CRISPR-associated protein Cas1
LIAEAREVAGLGVLPRPLDDSPKCRGCSLSGICLPDETNALLAVPQSEEEPEIRRFYPARAEALPFYVQDQGAKVGKRGKVLRVTKGDEILAEVRLKDVAQLVLCGSVRISAQTLHLLCEASVPIVHLSTGNWFHGVTQGFGLKNAFARIAQFQRAADLATCLELAKAFILAKVRNQRTLLRRNGQPTPDRALAGMSRLIEKIDGADSLGTLLGLEGAAARLYFGAFATMCRPPGAPLDFQMEGRNARPPRDPVNALLSFGYALLAKDCAVATHAVGLDAHLGFFHQPRHGKPALALDLMEEFRAVIVDSAVLQAINTGMVVAKNFRRTKSGCSLGPEGRKAFIRAYERRMQHLVTHPLFGYRCSWRQVLAVQATLLSRYLRGDLPSYQGVTPR